MKVDTLICMATNRGPDVVRDQLDAIRILSWCRFVKNARTTT
jgi:hypothetical protein